jgi:nucleotide-binding universal stress UspA family protein
MFTHLLVPVSSMEMIAKSLKNISKLVMADGAEVSLVHISEPTPPYMYADNAFGYGISDEAHKRSCQEYAAKLFERASGMLGQGVRVHTVHLFNSDVVDGILEANKKVKADVIVMASHKRSGFAGWFYGSDTQGLIAQTKTPVLVL